MTRPKNEQVAPFLREVPGRRSSRQLAARLSQDIPEGWFVNLGIGKPTAIANAVGHDREIVFHSENGVIGVGPFDDESIRDDDLINAGKQYITVVSGAAFISHCDSFALIRGGHLNLAVMGAFQVAENGDFANWSIPGDKVGAVGGAMDLGASAQRVWIMMDLFDRTGVSKIRQRCSYPLTSPGVVGRVYTDLALFEITPDGFLVRELVEGLSFDELQRHVPVQLRAVDLLR
jgi:3-oxoadipate CoA-transferase beta subunit